MTGTCLVNVVSLLFEPDASRAERQAAVDAVDGDVVGGNGASIYFVRISHDGSTGPLLEAIGKLREFPQVRYAGAFGTDRPEPDYLRPIDGEGWRAWQLDPASADGENWALEKIAGPMGWGCSFGSDSTRIGVIDRGFHDISSLSRNLDRTASVGFGAADSLEDDHGTRVAALAAGHGDDSTHVTGVMWRAGLQLYDISVAGLGIWSDVWKGVRRLGENGAQVINISLGYRWNRDPSAETDTLQQKMDAAAVARWFVGFTDQLNELSKQGLHPLVVFSAGNEGIDARWNPGRVAADSALYGDQVLVSGASNLSDGLASFSNVGSLVQVAAPGVGVHVLHGDSVVAAERPGRGARSLTGYGTSFAAPQVTGTAGLVASFDHRLSASELKSSIVDGAIRGGRDAGGIPILNAHESLKAAAERDGAPVCGNRLWIDDGQIATQRGDGGSVENLAPIDGEIGALMEALHGGKFLWYGTPTGDRVLRWEEGTWSSVGLEGLPSNVSELRSGTDASVHGQSHGRDTLLLTDVSETAGLWWFEDTGPVEAPLVRFVSGIEGGTVGSLTVRDLPFEHEEVCLERIEGGSCTSSLVTSRTWFFRLSYPQHDRSVFTTVSPVYFTFADSTAWQTCSYDADRECREVTFDQKHAGTLVYEVDLEDGGVTKVDSLSRMIFWLGQSESRPQQVLGRGTYVASGRFGAEQEHTTGDPEIERTIELDQCAIEYRRQDGFTLDRSIATDNACFFTFLNFPTDAGAGTFAPSLVDGTDAGNTKVMADGTTYVPEAIGPADIGVKEAP